MYSDGLLKLPIFTIQKNYKILLTVYSLSPLSTDNQSREWLLSAAGGKRQFPLFREAAVHRRTGCYHPQNFLYHPTAHLE